jgi:hypothetical protein
MRFAAILSALSLCAATEATTKIMALGDSITGTPGCWRAILYNRLWSLKPLLS